MSIELSKNSIDELADAIITRRAKFERTYSEKILRNTKELLKSYHLLESHLDVELPEIEEDTPLTRYELSLISLLGYRARSKEMMQFINKIFSRYKEICMNGSPEQQRRYKVIAALYINMPPMTRNKLSELFRVDDSTIRRDERKAINELSVMIFGINGLNDVTK